MANGPGLDLSDASTGVAVKHGTDGSFAKPNCDGTASQEDGDASLSGRVPCSDEEAEKLGIGTLVFFIVIGIVCFIVPRLGGWDARNVGFGHYVAAVGAACVLVVGYLYFTGRGDEEAGPDCVEEDDDLPPGAAKAGTATDGEVASVGVTETELSASDAVTTAAAEGKSVLRRRLQPCSEDPMWDADWANLNIQGRPDVTEAHSPSKAPVEIFELNDTPTWLARLQQRRDQALRMGKQKLVQKIDKEIAIARRAHAEDSTKSSVGVASAVAAHEGQKKTPRGVSDDVYGMDWSALPTTPKSESTIEPNVANTM
mmetsp:Transcript_17717/g.44871  ORF Transcript_17717/g.44871 Transcript_17717/m.44871 type:complete len:313 (+) Transcript_17717:104-1042(+)|eukprot:CAMPEP_0115443530 /NCGR_PEP_ID=MMETSP0271-20121206/37918_1 /TAXON_ID=71861 /ORGANISM="Scrippsiella trochoidea, Strain CCMP3099" /LENGTH=312 /DNA_ID=CAMNT_0002869413 /DNA_START=102 /DNA_END=1040 /DNA_ORIENTATION=+